MEKIYDVIIIGAGPAGMTSSIYASRANLDVLMVEKKYPGGQMLSTAEIENYTGYENITGPDLSEKMFEHSKKFGTDFVFGEIKKVKIENNIKILEISGKTYKAKSIIIATGTQARLLGIEGEKEFTSKGVSYCAVCDGAFFKGKNVVVIGGGDSAIEESLYLANLVNKVTVVHRRDELRAQKILQDRAFKKKNIEFCWDSIPVKINGEKKVTGIEVKNVKTNEIKKIEAEGIFIYIGMIPQTEVFKDLNILDEKGYVIADENMLTSVEGVFVAGDVRQKEIRQVVTATSDGAIAAQSAYKYIELL
ncbi:thioredoxin-disulfide reductase [Gemelliphila asaccharolytica]|uniref:Thioredoxin reductase n=1 Tax=Gemelliphila asaccharolytica TaxID=502393 RepID=A0ABR5TNG8_9BACL|nr:thioredoxin-disulfide reductase [Gemella asaccharolytica]KXB58965.1 thioredoxin-disulfide reductase [Gemella asaccharolytica]